MAKGKVNKNNPDNKSSGNNSSNNVKNNNTKKNKLISSEYCEKNCKDVGICEKYRNYIERMTVLHKVGKGIMCGK